MTRLAPPASLARVCAGPRGGATPRPPAVALALVAGSLVLAAASLAVVPAALAFDPFAWAVWGRQVVGLALDTSSIPSWKPGPVLVTAPLAALGLPADVGWLVVARAGGLLALAGAWALAARLGGRVAGPLAAGLLGLSPWWLENSALGNSEGLLAAGLLWAPVAHLAGLRRLCLGLLVAAALLRPEAWPLLGLYALWLARTQPGHGRAVAAALALVPLLWVLPDLWGSGELLRSSHTARGRPSPGSAGLAPVPALQVASDVVGLMGPVVAALAAGALAVAARGRDRRILWVGAGALGWVAIVAVMAQTGYAGRPRYSAPAAAIGCVLAAVAVARIGRAVAGRIEPRRGRARRASPRGPSALVAGLRPGAGRLPRAAGVARRGPGRLPGAPAVGRDGAQPPEPSLSAKGPRGAGQRRLAVAVAAALGTVLLVVCAFVRAPDLRATVADLEYRAGVQGHLRAALAEAGGRRALARCGHLAAYGGLQSALAWELGVPVAATHPLPAVPGAVVRLHGGDGRTRPPLEGAPARRLEPVARSGPVEVRAACAPAPPAPRADGGSRPSHR